MHTRKSTLKINMIMNSFAMHIMHMKMDVFCAPYVT